jgi:hypothetical protein
MSGEEMRNEEMSNANHSSSIIAHYQLLILPLGGRR